MLKLFSRPYRPGDERRLDLVRAELIPRYDLTIRAARSYFGHDIHGWDALPHPPGPVIFVMNHGVLPADAVLFAIAYYMRTGRHARLLCDRVLFRIAILRRFLLTLGCIEADQELAGRVLSGGDSVITFPGGAREGWKSSRSRHELRWEGRQGFARLACAHGVPIVPVANVGADDTYFIFNDGVATARRLFGLREGAWKNFPVPLFTGLGIIPFPAKLTSFIGEPVRPPAIGVDDAVLQRLHAETMARLTAMIADGEALHGRTFFERLHRRFF